MKDSNFKRRMSNDEFDIDMRNHEFLIRKDGKFTHWLALASAGHNETYIVCVSMSTRECTLYSSKRYYTYSEAIDVLNAR